MKFLFLIVSIFSFFACGTTSEVSKNQLTKGNSDLNLNSAKEENKNTVSKKIKTVKPNDLIPGRTVEIKIETTNSGDKNQDLPKGE